ncbi:hypothetical protein BC829DRAFT_391551 [Chytridium lagenaria]|nr:hypothetical protein BC829DRAFT_391551 [Chytridium lagenaria]
MSGNLTLDSSQIVPFAGIVLSIFLYAFRRPNYIPDQELYIFPWLLQILMSYTWLNYASHQKDLFIYLHAIPALVTGIAYTLQWHPYLRKRVRRAHQTSMIVGFTIILLATLGASVSPFLDQRVGRIGLGALAGATTLVMAVAMLRETVRSVFSEFVPSAMEFAISGLAVLFGGCWTAYGFYGANDPFIYVSNLIWVVHALLTLALLSYGAFRAGGLDMGFESGSEAGDEDMAVDRINRIVGNRSMQRSFRNPYHEEPPVVVTEAKYASEDEERPVPASKDV